MKFFGRLAAAAGPLRSSLWGQSGAAALLLGCGGCSNPAAAAAAAAASGAAAARLQQRRHLNLHEYQSMGLLRDYGVCTPEFQAVRTPEEAAAAAAALQQGDTSRGLVVKAQVLAGGRGLGRFKENGFQGGVHSVDSAAAAAATAAKMLGNTLQTKQTGDKGRPCNVVLICEKLPIKREMYLAIILDRAAGGPVVIGSAVGGTSIEDIAKSHPDAIVKMFVDLDKGIESAALQRFMEGLKISKDCEDEFAALLGRLYSLFREKDCLLVEINPLVETEFAWSSVAAAAGSVAAAAAAAAGGAARRLCAADGKLNIDDNAVYRQRILFEDRQDKEPGEEAAEALGVSYVQLSGDVGCLVNGAGLAMATMDIIQLKGGAPANFLDVGGGAGAQQIAGALRLLLSQRSTKALFLNIFGGIMRCDFIAQGLIQALRQVPVSLPIVVRLEGTKREEAEALISAALKDLEKEGKAAKLIAINDFDAAAEAAVRLSKGL